MRSAVAAVLLLLLVVRRHPPGRPGRTDQQLTIGAIPDQDPEKLQRLYGDVGAHLTEKLGVTVTYQPVTDYTASVTSFRRGDLDAVFSGGSAGCRRGCSCPGRSCSPSVTSTSVFAVSSSRTPARGWPRSPTSPGWRSCGGSR